jgi:hypothetical protein
MPRICEFLGITIGMYWNEEMHHAPHIHAEYGGDFASIAFAGTVLSGSLPPRQLRLVRRWASQHQSEPEVNWERSRRRDALLKIDPLA